MSSNGLIRVKREGAQRARRMASFMTAAEDKARMFAYADELDAHADVLEATEEGPIACRGPGAGPAGAADEGRRGEVTTFP